MVLGRASTSAATLLLLTLSAPTYKSAEAQSGNVQQYAAETNGGIVRLHDTQTETTVSLIPSAGNVVAEMRVRGHNVLRFPYESVADYKGTEGVTRGIPVLAPWGGRLR